MVTIKRLTERDLIFLELLCRSSVISTEQAGKIYGTNSYHQIRLSELASRGLIKREWGYVKPTGKCFKIFGIEPVYLKEEQKWKIQQLIDALDVYLNLSNWNFYFRREVKQKNTRVPQVSRLAGIAERDSIKYAVYIIPNKQITKRGLYALQNDIKSIISAGYEDIVIFYKHEEITPYLQENTCGSQSYLLLPFTKYGISVFDNRQEIYEYIEKTATEKFNNCERTEYQIYDYKAGDKYIMVLVDNDIIKYKLLEIYSKRYPKEDQIVICARDQKPLLKYLEEYITIKILETDKITEILKINELDENDKQQFKQHIQQLNKIPKRLPSGLTEREEKIFTMRYGIGCEKKYTIEELAKKFDVSAERIRQIENSALAILGLKKN